MTEHTAPEDSTAPPTHKGLGGVLALAGRHRTRLTIASLCAGLSSVLSITPLLVIYWVLMLFAQGPGASLEQLWPILAWGAAAMLLRWVLLVAGGVLAHLAAFDILFDLRLALANQLSLLPLGWITTRTSAIANQVLREDIDRLEQFIAHHLTDSVAAAALPLASAVALFWFDWRMALVTLITVPLAVAVQLLLWKRIPQIMAEYAETNANLSATIVDYVEGIAVLKTYHQGATVSNRLTQAINAYRSVIGRMVQTTVPGWSAFTVVIAANTLFILPAGGYFYLHGTLSLQLFALCLLLGLGITRPLFQLAFFGNLLRLVEAANNRIQALMQAPQLTQLHLAPPADPYACPALSFENVSFAYDQNEVLHNVSFSLPRGSLTAIVGPSGAGKSTVAQLMVRFWDASSGTIRLNGQDVRAMTLGDVHQQIAYVMQDVFLFNHTVLENIRLGRTDLDEAQVIEAAKAAQAHEFIQRLPQGYHTVLGERGARLSGGEKQRLSIARALIKDAPIIVLDEATAFADPLNEAQILEAIATLTRTRTVIVIAHRLSTIVEADQILLFDQGRLQANARHTELLQHSELYAQLWQLQQTHSDWRISSHPTPTHPARQPLEDITP